MTLEKLKALADTLPELELIRTDDPRGQPSPFYRALIGLCQSDEGYCAIVRKDGQEFYPSLKNCEALGSAVVAIVNNAPALLSAQAAEIERLKAVEEEAIFLTERLTDFDNYSENKTEDGERDWHGHVAPSLSRLKTAIKARAALQTQAGGE